MTETPFGRFCSVCGALFYCTNRDPKEVEFCTIKCFEKGKKK